MLLRLTIIVYFCVIAQTFAQLKVELGETFSDKHKRNEPAIVYFNFQNNDTTSDTFVADMALGLTFEDVIWNGLSLSFVSEWHRNTQIKNKRHVQQLGLNLKKPFDFQNSSHFTLELNANGKYSHDLRATEGAGETGIYSAYINPYWSGVLPNNFLNYLRPGAIMPDTTTKASYIIQYEYLFGGGLEYIKHDDLLIGNVNAQLILYPASKALARLLNQTEFIKIQANITERTNHTNNDSLELSGFFFSYQIGVQYKLPDKKGLIGLSLDYINGANPLIAQIEQNYHQVTIKTKLSLSSNNK
ncbi:hypothetical protein [Fulvivirga sp.]|uniref:hypothetical protein n=1 Tax=Fulvivirga sp. TaxID=1931237 RepID=UPI0032EE6C76